jgi:predicted HTH transcriptional regulator
MAKGTGLAIGVAIGLALGVAMGNIGAGIAIGVAIGVALDVSNARKQGDNAENDARSAEKDAVVARILAEMQKRGTMTNHDVREFLGVADSTAERYLQELEVEGKIVQVGTTGHTVSYKAL